MKAVDRKQLEETRLQRALALEVARPFCKQHGYSFEKLKEQRFFFNYGTAAFAQPTGIKPNGLLNDMKTMPLPTLIIKSDGENLTVETTEHTEKYLK